MQINPYQKIDNSPLIVFRIFFGFLIAAESFGSILTGWVKDVFVEPELDFQHIGFQWLVPLDGNGMYFYYAIMGVLDRKSTRLNSSHVRISYAVFCLKKKKKTIN